MKKSGKVKRCQQKKGLLLLEKRCPEPVVSTCGNCGDSFCKKHTRNFDGNSYCQSCYDTAEYLTGQSESADQAEQKVFYFDSGLGIFRRDPYLYADTNYDGWGRYEKGYYGARYSDELKAQEALEAQSPEKDVNDFTDGDSEVFEDTAVDLETFEDSEEFENDLDAS